MEEILKDLNDINTTRVLEGGGDSSDTGWWVDEKKVPGVELYSANENYFHFHHSNGKCIGNGFECRSCLYIIKQNAFAMISMLWTSMS